LAAYFHSFVVIPFFVFLNRASTLRDVAHGAYHIEHCRRAWLLRLRSAHAILERLAQGRRQSDKVRPSAGHLPRQSRCFPGKAAFLLRTVIIRSGRSANGFAEMPFYAA
jgi:hypothetical protein